MRGRAWLVAVIAFCTACVVLAVVVVADPALIGGSDGGYDEATSTAPWPIPGGRGPCAVSVARDVPARMRDGTVLRSDVYRPATGDPVPVILQRTQYGKAEAETVPSSYQSPDWFASHCYLVVIQDVRGQYASDGQFYEFASEVADGYDSVEWAAALPGSNGNVGMYGSSYVGATQWLAAKDRPPHLRTIVPALTSSDYYEGWTYQGGALRLNFITPWAMRMIVRTAADQRRDRVVGAQIRSDYLDVERWLGFTPYNAFPPFHPGDPVVAPYYFDWLAHPTYDAYWRQWAPKEFWHDLDIPVLDVAGWYDAFLDGAIENYTGMTAQGGPDARGNQRIVVGPWDHTGWGRPTSRPAPMLAAIGPAGNSPIDELMLSWWDHYLKGEDNGVTRSGVDYFLMGENRWHHADRWPLAGTRFQDWFLASTGRAAGTSTDGTLSAAPPPPGTPPDGYVYDPRNPAPSVGGHSCCTSAISTQGPYDQLAVEARPDVATYTSAPLAADTEVTGPITVTLYAASSAPDTDWTAKLVDVHPDNTAVNLNQGIVRASYRDSLSAPTPIVPGRVYEYRIKVWPTSNLFRAGHRYRLEISSSDFPQFDPNPNTGATLATSTETRPAQQTVLHDPAHPSHVTLPVIPAGASSPGADRAPTS